MYKFFPLNASSFTGDKKAVKTDALVFSHVVLTSDDVTVVHHHQKYAKCSFSNSLPMRDHLEIFSPISRVWCIHFRQSSHYYYARKIPPHLAEKEVSKYHTKMRYDRCYYESIPLSSAWGWVSYKQVVWPVWHELHMKFILHDQFLQSVVVHRHAASNKKKWSPLAEESFGIYNISQNSIVLYVYNTRMAEKKKERKKEDERNRNYHVCFPWPP